MKTYLDCIPCLLRQALEAARLFSADPAVHERILRDVLAWCGDMDMSKPAPLMGRRIYRRLREITGVKDPYLAAKKKQNRLALRLLPELRAAVRRARDRLGLAARLAVAGNIIDMDAAAVCPTQAIIVDKIAVVLAAKCSGCGDCVPQCPVEAIILKKKMK